MQAKTAQDIRYQTVGKFIKEKREKKNRTQWDVAKALDYSTAQFVSNWERGVSMPPIDAVPIIAEVCGCSKKELTEKMKMTEIKEVEFKYRGMK